MMYRSFAIRNFRCFRDFRIGDLERVNLIAGANNVGKTALLEAFFVQLKQRIRALREPAELAEIGQPIEQRVGIEGTSVASSQPAGQVLQLVYNAGEGDARAYHVIMDAGGIRVHPPSPPPPF